jgi:hypothetical protein
MKLSYIRNIIRRKLNENNNIMLSETEFLNEIDSNYIDEEIENDEINPWGDEDSEDLEADADFIN